MTRNSLRDSSEVTVGRIRTDGGWDHRYRIRHTPPEPYRPDPMRVVAEVLLGVVVMGSLIVAVLLWMAIATVSRV